MAIDKILSLLGEKLGRECPSITLNANTSTGLPPVQPGEVDEHTEKYLTLKGVEEFGKGIPTAVLGGVGGATSLLMSLAWLFGGDINEFLSMLLCAVAFFIIPFAWEVLSPLPLPIMFNRRTREVYFDHKGELYHTPWDGITAVAYEYQMVHQNTGSMSQAPLEVLVHRYGKPEQQLLINLGVPVGKSIELQRQFWEYLRCYMENGPWFDAEGKRTEDNTFIREQLSYGWNRKRDAIKLTWKRRQHMEWPSLVFMLAYELLMYPAYVLWDFTLAMAKRRTRSQWPDTVRERLKSDGPTTRLIDLEQASAAVSQTAT